MGSIPGSGISPEEENDNPLVFLPGKSHYRGARWATVQAFGQELGTTEWLNNKHNNKVCNTDIRLEGFVNYADFRVISNNT